MSDLLPLVCETLRDRVLLEAQEEIVRLRKIEAVAQSVEIVHIPSRRRGEDDDDRVDVEDQPFTVIASGSIVKDGTYGTNDRYWEISLTQINPCPLAHLKDCRIQVGGGYDCVNLSPDQQNDVPLEILPDRSDLDTRSSKFLSMCTRNVAKPVWMDCVVHNWPTWRQERDSPEESGWNELRFGNGVEYLHDTVARQHPDATIEFLSVSLFRAEMHPAMQRLIPRAELMEARKERYDPPPQELDPEREKLEVDHSPSIAYAIVRYRRFATPEQEADPTHLQQLLEYLPAMEDAVRSIVTPIVEEEGFHTPDEVYVERVVLSYIDHSLEDFQSTTMKQLITDRVRYIMELNESVIGRNGRDDDGDEDDDESVDMADSDDEED